jgi:hypothetical protein
MHADFADSGRVRENRRFRFAELFVGSHEIYLRFDKIWMYQILDNFGETEEVFRIQICINVILLGRVCVGYPVCVPLSGFVVVFARVFTN